MLGARLVLMTSLLAIAGFTPASAHGQAHRSPPAYTLLVSSTRPGPGQKPLSYTSREAERIKAVLTELGGYRPENTSVIHNPRFNELSRALSGIEATLREHEARGEDAGFGALGIWCSQQSSSLLPASRDPEGIRT